MTKAVIESLDFVPGDDKFGPIALRIVITVRIFWTLSHSHRCLKRYWCYIS